MNWRRPRNAAQWMLLCTPAVAALLALWAAEVWMEPVPRFYVREGLYVVNVGAVAMRGAMISIGAIAGFSLPLAIILTRNQPWPARIANTLGAAFCLVFFNSFIAFGGCMLVGVASSVVSR